MRYPSNYVVLIPPPSKHITFERRKQALILVVEVDALDNSATAHKTMHSEEADRNRWIQPGSLLWDHVRYILDTGYQT